MQIFTKEFKSKERQTFYTISLFYRSIKELRSTFIYYNPKIKKIGMNTISDFFHNYIEILITKIKEIQKTTIEEILEKLLYANKSLDYDMESLLKFKLEKIDQEMRYQFLRGKQEEIFFGEEQTPSEQEIPKIIFPSGFDKQMFPGKETKKRITKKNEANNREELEEISLEENKHPVIRETVITKDLRIKGTELLIEKDNNAQVYTNKIIEEDIPPENITIENQAFEFKEELSAVFEIKNYKLNLKKKSDGKYIN